MSRRLINRRALISAVGSVGVLNIVDAQQTSNVLPSPLYAGDDHIELMLSLKGVLRGAEWGSKEALHRLLVYLVKQKYLTAHDAEVLGHLLDVIFSGETVNQLDKAIKTIYNESAKTANDLASAILSIARSSIANVQKFSADATVQRAIAIVAADVNGAMTGAFTCQKYPRWAVVAALAGAVYSSSNIIFSSQSKTAAR